MNDAAFVDSLSPEGRALAPDIQALINDPAWLVGSAAIDGNGDGALCIKPKPPTKGNLYGWAFNAVDNTAQS